MLTALTPSLTPTSLPLYPPLNDGIISPFLLDPTTITSPQPHSTHLHKAIWLHMPVMLRRLTPNQLHQLTYLSNLRHPNLEQFLGAVVRPSDTLLVTEYIPGTSLSSLAHPHPRAPGIALDIARALVYLHRTTGPHGGLSADAVVYDEVRRRAVVLLPTGRREGSDGARAADVYSLALLVLLLFGADAAMDSLPAGVRHVVARALCRNPRERPRVEEMCRALMDAQHGL